MKIYLFVFLVAIFSYKAQSKREEKVIWMKPNPMPFKEFKVNVKALGYPHVSYAEEQLRLSRKKAQSFQLKEKLISAQELYLSGEENKARKAFQNISKMALQADWNQEDRRILIYAFLRQAQMEQRPEQKTALLLSAMEFALFKINSLDYSDYHLFPPPLLQEIQLLQEKVNYFLADWNSIFPQHEILLINGQRFKKDKKIKIPQALYRVSAFSSSHESWSENKNFSELLTENIKTKTLTMGFCEKRKIKPANIKENIKLMPFSNCDKIASLNLRKNTQSKSKRKQLLQTKSSASKWDSVQTDSKLLNSLEFSEDLTADLKKPALKKHNIFSDLPPWIIAGAGVAAFIFILSLQQDKEVKKGEYVY